MEKKYEQTLFQKIKELIVVIVGGACLAFICAVILLSVYSIWPEAHFAVYIVISIVFAVIYLIVLFKTIRNFFDRFYVKIDSRNIYIHESRKVEHTFELVNTSISYRVETGNTGFNADLIFVDLEGKETSVDMTRLGETKTWQIIEDLKLNDVNSEENIIKL